MVEDPGKTIQLAGVFQDPEGGLRIECAFLNNILFSLRIDQYSCRPEITELWTLWAKGQVADLFVTDLTPEDDQDCDDDNVGDNKTTNQRHLYCTGYTLGFGKKKTTQKDYGVKGNHI